MKLLNNTPIPDKVLRALLVRAGRAVGAKTAQVVVQVNRSQHPLSSIRASAYDYVRIRWGGGSGRPLKCDGAFKITLPVFTGMRDCPSDVVEHRRAQYNPLWVAEEFYRVARHEWGHIRDFQHGGYSRMEFSWRVNGRREAHDSRPEEIRAENYAYDADRAGRNANAACEEIMALAIALEGFSRLS